MMASLAVWLFRRPWIGWGVLAILTAASLVGIGRIEYDDDLRSSFRAEGDAGSLGVGEEAFVCIVRGENLGDGEVIPRLIEFDQELRKVPGIRRVASIFGGIFTDEGELSDQISFTPGAPPRVGEAGGSPEGRRVSEVERLFRGESGRTILFAADPDPGVRLVKDLEGIQVEIQRLLDDLTRRTGLAAEIAGVPALRIEVVEMARREQAFYSIGSCLLGGVIALVMFRRAAALAVVFPVPVVAILWAVGGMGLAGEPVNSLNIMIAVLIPIISLTDAIHLTYAIRRHLAGGKGPRRAALAGLAEVGFACFMTSFTTAVSFASLMLSSNAVVARFGAYCACGILSAFLAVVLLTPLAASLFPARFLLPRRPPSGPPSWFARLAGVVVRHPVAIVAVSGAITLAGVLACLRLEFDFRYSEALDPVSKTRRAIDLLDSEFGGSQPLFIVAEWPAGPPMEERRILSTLEAVHAAVHDPARTGHPFSIRSLWQEAAASRPGAGLADLAGIFPGFEIESLLDLKGGSALVRVPLRDEGAKALAPLLDEIEARLAAIEREHAGFRIRTAGLTAASIRHSEPMIRELTASLFSAGLVIFISIGISVRSWKLGLASVIPNILPMVMAGAWLYWSGEQVRYISALCFSICLGVAVDDTIHFLFRYRENRRRGAGPAAAVRETIGTIGTALLTTTVILLGGFALLLTSGVPTIRLFGVMGILSLAVALAGDLVVLPALLLLKKRPTGGGPAADRSDVRPAEG